MRQKQVTISQEDLHHLFIYDPIVGELVRRDLPNAKPITLQYVSIKGDVYSTNRIIFCYMEGYMPDAMVMRIDKDVRNNRWDNFTIVKTKINPRNKQVIRIKSRQVRGEEMPQAVLLQKFRYEEITGNLVFITKDGREIVTDPSKPNLSLKGRVYPRHYLIRRLRSIADMERENRKPVHTIQVAEKHLEPEVVSVRDLEDEFTAIFKPVI